MAQTFPLSLSSLSLALFSLSAVHAAFVTASPTAIVRHIRAPAYLYVHAASGYKANKTRNLKSAVGSSFRVAEKRHSNVI